MELMVPINIHSEEFAQAAAEAGLRARRSALTAGHAVVFVDKLGRYVQEMPDGRLFEIRFIPGAPRESHIEVLGELLGPRK